MSFYQFLLMVHILGVILWLGTLAATTLLLLRARASGRPESQIQQIGDARWLDLRLTMPASLTVLLAGGWLMTEGDWPFDTAIWIHIGMGALIAAAGISMVWTRRHSRTALHTGTGARPNITALAGRIVVGNVGSIALILIGLWAMVAKPSVS